jgi:predicted amidohydrolase YtcJ
VTAAEPAPPLAITGRIVTVTGAADAEALLSRDGRIEAVGDRGIAARAAEAGIEVRHGPGRRDRAVQPAVRDLVLHGPRGYWDRPIELDERISFAEALRLFTLEGARVLGLDGEIGSLEPGKRADVVVLDRDPRSRLDDVRHALVDSVYLDGAEVLHRPGRR